MDAICGKRRARSESAPTGGGVDFSDDVEFVIRLGAGVVYHKWVDLKSLLETMKRLVNS